MNVKQAWKTLFAKPRRTVRASGYNAAQTNDNNSNHWQNTKFGTGDQALLGDGSLNVIRARIREEMRNNSYMLGIVRKLSDYVISTGPNLQVCTDSRDFNQEVEGRWKEWADNPENCDIVGLQSYADMLHTGIEELYPAGEYLRQFVQDPDTSEDQISLKMFVTSPERLSTPGDGIMNSNTVKNIVAGVEKDTYGKAIRYWISKNSSDTQFTNIIGGGYSDEDYNQVAAQNMVHVFIADRPEMTRGTPLGAAILNIFATLRRFDEATIRAAEAAALVAGFMTTEAPDNWDPDVDPETFELSAGAWMTLPPGSKIQQVTPQHPSGVYETFKKGKLMDAGASTSMPYNVLASDSSGHNYASGRLDWQGLVRAVKVHRQRTVRRDCKPTFNMWYGEARNHHNWPGTIPPCKFMFPGFEHVDPGKEAKAAVVRIEANLQTYADYFAEQGKDWRDEFAQMAEEDAAMDELGLGIEEIIEAPAETEEAKMERVIEELAELQGVDTDDLEVEIS